MTTTARDFVHDVPRILPLHGVIERLTGEEAPALSIVRAIPEGARCIAILAGSFNPLTRGHEALAQAALTRGLGTNVLLMPVRAVDKEGVTRASPVDRVLVVDQWAARFTNTGVAVINRGLFVEQAELLAEAFPGRVLTFAVGFDKIVQILDSRYYTDRTAALDRLFALASFAVAPRSGRGVVALHDLLDQPENRTYAAGVTTLSVPAEIDALSSSMVRQSVRDGGRWEEFVPPETAALLHASNPYSAPVVLPDGDTIDAYGIRLALVEAAAAGRMPPSSDFETLVRNALQPTPAGRRIRAVLIREAAEAS